MNENRFYSECTLDERGLVTLPESWLKRVDLVDGVVILPHLPSPLPDYLATDVWPNNDDYEVHMDQVDSIYYSRSKRTKELLRLVYGSISYEPVDEEGRIRVPGAVKDISRLEGRIVCVDLVDHVELWNADIWHARMQVFENSFTDFFP